MFYPAHIFNKTNIILYKIYKRNIYVVWNLYISDVQCIMLYAHALIMNNYHYMNLWMNPNIIIHQYLWSCILKTKMYKHTCRPVVNCITAFIYIYFFFLNIDISIKRCEMAIYTFESFTSLDVYCCIHPMKM